MDQRREGRNHLNENEAVPLNDLETAEAKVVEQFAGQRPRGAGRKGGASYGVFVRRNEHRRRCLCAPRPDAGGQAPDLGSLRRPRLVRRKTRGKLGGWQDIAVAEASFQKLALPCNRSCGSRAGRVSATALRPRLPA
jgi:hypothetical protein